MKKFLFKVFVIYPIGLPCVTILSIVLILFIFRGVYVNDYYEIDSFITADKKNATIQFQMDEDQDIQMGDEILVYWDINEYSFDVKVEDILESNGGMKYILALKDSDKEYMDYINEDLKATLRIYKEPMHIMKKLFV